MKINYDLIGRALIHPVQEKVLRLFADVPGVPGDYYSPKEMERHLDIPLATVSYHMRLLAGLPCGKQKSPFAAKPLLRQVDTKPRRGALEHFYALTKEATVDRLDAAEGEGRR